MQDPYSHEALSRLDAGFLRTLSDSIDAILERHETNEGRKRSCTGQEKTDEDQQWQEQNRLAEKEESNKAGQYVLPFGKYKGNPIHTVDVNYLSWALGMVRRNREFVESTRDGYTWIQENYPTATARIRLYLTHRCWVCKSQDVKFSNSRMCRSCWVSSGPGLQ
jgi:hypothetical protein